MINIDLSTQTENITRSVLYAVFSTFQRVTTTKVSIGNRENVRKLTNIYYAL